MSTEPSARPAIVASLLAGRHEPAEQANRQRKGGEALRERRVVLGRKDGRRHEDRDLATVLDRLERRPDRDLGLAVADITDDQPIHRPA